MGPRHHRRGQTSNLKRLLGSLGRGQYLFPVNGTDSPGGDRPTDEARHMDRERTTRGNAAKIKAGLQWLAFRADLSGGGSVDALIAPKYLRTQPSVCAVSMSPETTSTALLGA